MSSPVSFPAPVGGVPFESDFIPSIVFACFYAVLVFVGVFRMAVSSTRSVVLIGLFIFVFERVVIYSLRAKQAKTPSEDFDRNLTIYWQVTYAIGYITIYTTLANLLRCLFVNTTKGVSPNQAALLSDQSGFQDSYANESTVSGYTLPVEEDKPETRFWYRNIFRVLLLSAWPCIILGVVMGYSYVSAETNESKAGVVQDLRLAVSALAFTLILSIQGLSVYALVSIPRVKRSAALVTLAAATILNVIPIYHFVMSHSWTTSLTSTAPGSQNTSGEKLAFYICQATPEVICGGIVFMINARGMFGTGLWGDKSHDSKNKNSKA